MELCEPLPGWEAQVSMTSRSPERIKDHIRMPPDPKKAGVLIPLFPYEDEAGIIFMKRPEYEGVHSGQISFPGGRVEPTDLTLTDTALRETEEELGIEQSMLFTIGELTNLYIPPSNFLVTPIVGYLVARPDYTPDPAEVDRVIEIKLSDLLDEGNRQTTELRVRNGTRFNVPGYVVDGHTIWGATAMILSEFLEVARKIIKRND
jgi:8-oxo-dGTP pyrophosphatase MutT (NUDIX family)